MPGSLLGQRLRARVSAWQGGPSASRGPEGWAPFPLQSGGGKFPGGLPLGDSGAGWAVSLAHRRVQAWAVQAVLRGSGGRGCGGLLGWQTDLQHPRDSSSYQLFGHKNLRFELETACPEVAAHVGFLGGGQRLHGLWGVARASGPALPAAFRAHLCSWPRGRRPLLCHQ